MEKKFINGEFLTIEEAYEKHEGLIWKVVHRFKGATKSSKISFDDLFMIGCEGFTKAFNRFDYDKFPVKFSTYAIPMIQGSIQIQLRDKSDDIKFSRSVKDLAFKIGRDELLGEKREIIAEIYGISIQEVDTAFIFLANREIPSLETPTNIESDGSESSLGDVIGDKRLFDDTDIHVQEFLNSLDTNVRRTVEMTIEGKVQKEIAKVVGVTQTQVSRYLKKVKSMAEKFFNYKHIASQKKEEPEKMTKTNVGNLELAKELLRTTDKSVGEISRETLCTHGAVKYWEKKLRNKEKPELWNPPIVEEAKSFPLERRISTFDAVNSEEENRELIIEESEINFLYSIRNKDLSPSDLHVLFTQIGNAAATSGVKKLDVNLKISVPK